MGNASQKETSEEGRKKGCQENTEETFTQNKKAGSAASARGGMSRFSARDLWRVVGLLMIVASLYAPHRTIYEGWPGDTKVWSDSLLLVTGIFLLVGVQIGKLALAYKRGEK